MILIYRILLSPALMLQEFTARWRRKLFKLKIWKSVEFEIPTIACLCNPHDNILPVLNLLNNVFLSDGHTSITMMTEKSALNRGLKSKKIEGAEYIKSLVMIEGGEGAGYITYKGSSILPLSEGVSIFPNSKAVLTVKYKLFDELRHHVSILITSFDHFFWEEDKWPLGTRLESNTVLSSVDFVFFTYSDLFPDYNKLRKLRARYCKPDVKLVFIRIEDEVKGEFKRLYYSNDETEFIEDHHTFASMFLDTIFGERK